MTTIHRLGHLFIFFFLALGLASCDRGKNPVKGDKLNDYFPKDSGKISVTVTTEQKGFAQALLKSDGTEIATLAITDLVKDEETRKRYEGATAKDRRIPGHLPRQRWNRRSRGAFPGPSPVQGRSFYRGRPENLARKM